MSLLRPLMAGVLLLAVPSSALGPPNGTVGTLDFRYPNSIVEPLVDCPFEGYFPHPRNNTWFYRCYNRYGSSFFWRAYFQCPPCTVFSDALDQCVFQETGTQCFAPPAPCRKTFEDCRLVGICSPAKSTVEVCFKTTLQCPGQLDRPLCPVKHVFDRTNGWCRVDGFYNCVSPASTTTSTTQAPPTTQPPPTTTTTTAPAPSPENCAYFGEILGMARDNCSRSCGDSGQPQASYPYCGNFFQCTLIKYKFFVKPASCPSEYTFDTTTSTCRKITRNGSKGPGGCITLDSSTNSSEPECIYSGQLPVNLNTRQYPELPCDERTKCSDGSLSVTLCKEFYLCREDAVYGGEMFPQPTRCRDSAKKFNPYTRKCVTPHVC